MPASHYQLNSEYLLLDIVSWSVLDLYEYLADVFAHDADCHQNEAVAEPHL